MEKAGFKCKETGLIPTKDMSARELTERLRSLVDIVSSPEIRYENPSRFAESYHQLITLAETYREKLGTPYVVHNLGKWRLEYVENLLGD